MRKMSFGWGDLRLQSKLQILIQGLLILVLVAAQHWLLGQFEQRALKAAEDRTRVAADGIFNGLNTLMSTEVKGKDVISDKKARALFIEKMGISDKLKELRVIRGKGTTDEFGPGLPQEQPVDELDHEVLSTGKTLARLGHPVYGPAALRLVLPYIAFKEFRTSKCLECHGVDDGTVIGAVSVITDIEEDLVSIHRINLYLWAGQAVLQLLLFFAVRAIVARQLSQLGAEPAEAVQLAQSVAAGDLSHPVSLRKGDQQSMMAQLVSMQKSLTHLVSNVRTGAEGVAVASAEIAQGNGDLSVRTEQQASALEQTASAMSGLGEAVSKNADFAREANQLALDASTIAVEGGDVVGQVVTTMKGINESSHRISDIISVIDGIAFQTNILALNAAVEAARAGEQGRGFAVVASEVRSLAGRSSDAAREIKGLILASVDRVDSGTRLVDQAGSTMTKVVSSIQRLTELIGQISAASRQQADSVQQVGEAVLQMDQSTQQNAALVEQMAAAASSLKTLADELVRSVSVFKLQP